MSEFETHPPPAKNSALAQIQRGGVANPWFRWSLALGLSLALHFLSAGVGLWWGPQPPPTSAAIEVQVIPSQRQKPQTQIVRSTLTPDSLKVPVSPDPLRFASENTQSVREQTRAQQVGQTQNRSAPQGLDTNQAERKAQPQSRRGPEAQPQQRGEGDRVSRLAQATSPEATREIPNSRQEISAPVLPLPSGVSTFGNSVPDSVRIGQVTALNTDRYLFYTYYARAEEIFRGHWQPILEAMVDRPPPAIRQAPANRYATVVETQYRPSGELLRVLMLKSSGIAELDEAALVAFQRARMIPNPPKEKIEADGLVKIQWRVTVELDPRAFARR